MASLDGGSDDDDAPFASPLVKPAPDGRHADASAAKFAALLLDLEAKGTSVAAAFRAMDLDGDGALTAPELHAGLRALDVNHFADLAPADVWRVLRSIDLNGDGRVALEELDRFVAGRAAASRQGHRLSRRQVIGSGRVAVLLAVGAVGCRRG